MMRALAAAMLRVYTQRALWQRLSDGGYSHVARHFTPEVVERIINDSLRKTIERGLEPRDASADAGEVSA